MAAEVLNERPELTEWDLQAIQEELEIALKRKCETLVKTWRDGRITLHQGVIEGIDLQEKCVMLQDPFEMEIIHVAGIIGVQCMD